MNQCDLIFLCKKFNLGSSIEPVVEIYGSRGGSRIWRVRTEKGIYAIKQLSPEIDIKNEKIINKYELSETIAYKFSQHGISAVFAFLESGKRLTIQDNIGYLIYPWIEGFVLKRNEVSEPHALKIAEITAKMHSINMSVPEVGEPRFDIHSNDSIVDAIEKAISFKCPFKNVLKEKQNLLLTLNNKYLDVIPILREHSVVTHGDLDQLNVIWIKPDQPTLIDWESAKKVNPTFEILRTSIRFSGGVKDEASLLIYKNMLHTYEKFGGLLDRNHIEAALQAMSGGTINWFLYNVDLACTSNNDEKKTRAWNEVERVLESSSKSKEKLYLLAKIK